MQHLSGRQNAEKTTANDGKRHGRHDGFVVDIAIAIHCCATGDSVGLESLRRPQIVFIIETERLSELQLH